MFWLVAAAFVLCASKPILEQKPCAVAYTPNSILQSPPSDSFLRYAETRPRFSTCGGVAWFQGSKYLFAVNMQTSSVQVYEFHEDSKRLVPVKGFTNQDGISLARPEGVCISKDEAFLAIPNMKSGKLQIYNTAAESFMMPSPLVTVQAHKLHGARFSPDGRFISYTGFGERSKIYTSRFVNKRGKLSCITVQEIPNQFEPLRPKSIDFSCDGRLAAIGYCTELMNQKGPTSLGILATYHRDPETGVIDLPPISYIEGLASLETVIFCPNSCCIFAVDQVNDRITAHAFDEVTGELGDSWTALQNPEAELSLCHGIAITPDGKYVAVSNYGDDKVTVYAVQNHD